MAAAMELVGFNGSLRLTVIGYEFPKATEWWDANWLTVRADVRHLRGSWAATAPCLLTTDLLGLAAWFEQLAEGSRVDEIEEFIEPNLRFERVDGDADGLLRVVLALELLPRWVREHP